MGEAAHCMFWRGCTEWVRRHVSCFGEGVLSGSDRKLRVLVRVY